MQLKYMCNVIMSDGSLSDNTIIMNNDYRKKVFENPGTYVITRYPMTDTILCIKDIHIISDISITSKYNFRSVNDIVISNDIAMKLDIGYLCDKCVISQWKL